GGDDDRLHRRLVDLEEPLAEPRHAQRPGRGRPQVVAVQRPPVEAEEPARVIPGAPARVAPIAGDAGDAGDGPDGHPATAVPLRADRERDGGGAGVSDAPAQPDDGPDWKARDAGHSLRWVLEDALAKRLPAERVALDEFAILGALRQDHVEKPQRQRRVGP